MYGFSIFALYRNVKVIALSLGAYFKIQARQIDLIAEAFQEI